MNRYSLIQRLVQRLTDDDTFRTFYTLYLTAENERERELLGKKFWADVEVLPVQEQKALRAEFTRSFLKLPRLLEELHERSDTAQVA